MDNSAPEDFADASEHKTIRNKLTNKGTKGRCQWFKDFCIIITEGSYLHTCTHILPIKSRRSWNMGSWAQVWRWLSCWLFCRHGWPRMVSLIFAFSVYEYFGLFIIFSLFIRDVGMGSEDIELDEREKSNMDSSRMFKLRRSLDQLDRFYKQKELNVLKARSVYTHIHTHTFQHILNTYLYTKHILYI